MSQGRSVLVTGASKGIGHAIAAAFVAQGDRVAATYRSGSSDDVPRGALAVPCDVASTESVDAAFAAAEAAHGPVEVVIANAGMTRDQLVLRMSDQDFTDVVDTNLTGAFRVVRRGAKGMLRLRRGRVVLISSVVGHLGSPGQVSYGASKAGLLGLARSLAREVGVRGITANVVAPGFIETDMTAALAEAQQAEYRGRIPLDRFGTIEDVADTVLFLAGPGASYITGALVPVDGGLGMGH